MTQVFISHSSRDAAFVLTHIKPVFDAAGVLAWCSATDVRVAADWERQIRTALSQTNWFVVVLSPDAQRSAWVQSETHWALEHLGGRIIPVMVRDCDPCEIHLRLGTLQYIDFRSDPAHAAQRLLALVDGQVLAPASATGTSLHPAAAEPTTIIRDSRHAALRVFIELPSGPGVERVVQVQRSVTLGRAVDAGMQIADDCISRKHARIAVLPSDQAPFLTITDLDSANGTFLNHVRIYSEQRLAVGDLIEVGNSRLQVLAIEAHPPPAY